MKYHFKLISQNSTTAYLTTGPYLTNPFHHDRGRFVFAVSPRRGEQGALGRRLRRGNEEQNIRPSAHNTISQLTT